VASLYFVASGRFSVSEGLTYTLIYGGIGSLLAIAAGLGILQFNFPFLDKASRGAFHLALLSIPLSLFSLILLNLLTAVRHFSQYALVSIGQGLSNLIFVFIYVRLLGGGVNGALLAIITTGTIIILFTLYLFRRDFTVTWVRPSLARLREMIHYGLRYYLGKISNMANFQIGTIILAFFAGKAEIAFFAVAMRAAVQILIIPDTLTFVLIPRSARDPEGKKVLVALCSRLTALICGIGLLILGLMAEPLVKIVFSPAFLPAVPLIRIICLGVWIRAAAICSKQVANRSGVR
jgi:O-antigen/teichoic acid export membrane protein